MKMLKFLKLMIILIIIVSCKEDNNSSEEIQEIPDPSGFYSLDIKTSFLDKSDYEGIKKGIIDFVDFGSICCEKVEFGEDFEVWIEDVRREKLSEIQWKVRFRLVIKKTYLLDPDEIFLNEFVTCIFEEPENYEEVMLSSEKARLFVHNSIQLSKTIGKYDPSIYSISVTAEKLNELLSSFRNSQLDKVKKLEALFCGTFAGERMKLAFVNYENGKEM